MATKSKGKYYRKKVRHPVTGEYRDVYGKTWAEVKEKKDALEAAWAKEIEDAESPYFFQYASDWFARVSPDMSEARRKTIAREINSFICPVIGQKKLRELTSDDVMDVMARRAKLSRSAQEKTLQTLRRILAAAENAGKLPRNPARDLRPGGKPAQKKEALTDAQQKVLLDAVKGRPIDLFIRLGLYAGLRREEIVGLAWKDVHLDGSAPHIDVRQACRWPRNNRPEIAPTLKSEAAWRTVPVPPPLLEALRSAMPPAKNAQQDAPSAATVLSTASGGPWTYQTFRRAWSAVEARTAKEGRPLGSSVPKHPDVKITIDFPVTPHILRHTYITKLILGGVDVRRVQYLAGHETPDVTLQIYTHLMGHRPEDLIDDVSAIFPG